MKIFKPKSKEEIEKEFIEKYNISLYDWKMYKKYNNQIFKSKIFGYFLILLGFSFLISLCVCYLEYEAPLILKKKILILLKDLLIFFMLYF